MSAAGSNLHQGPGLTVVNPPALRRALDAPHVLICSGAARGGTTALAYALIRAGIGLGQNLDLNLEDPRFVACMSETGIDKQRLRAEIAAPPDTARWGFKLPAAVFHLRWLDRNAPNPVFVITLRSPLSVALSAIRHDPVFPPDAVGLKVGIEHALTYYGKVAAALPDMTAPVLLVDYERLHYRAEETLTELFDVLWIDAPNLSEIAAELAQPGYKDPPA